MQVLYTSKKCTCNIIKHSPGVPCCLLTYVTTLCHTQWSSKTWAKQVICQSLWLMQYHEQPSRQILNEISVDSASSWLQSASLCLTVSGLLPTPGMLPLGLLKVCIIAAGWTSWWKVMGIWKYWCLSPESNFRACNARSENSSFVFTSSKKLWSVTW